MSSVAYGTCLYIPVHALTHVVHQPGAEGRGGRERVKGTSSPCISVISICKWSRLDDVNQNSFFFVISAHKF